MNTPTAMAQAAEASDLELQQMLVDSVRRWGQGANGPQARAQSSQHAHGCPPERWRALAELGWLGLDLPEDEGGLGAGLTEVCLLAEQMGACLLVEPFVANAVLGRGVLTQFASPAQRAQWLPDLVSGEHRLAWMAWEADGQALLRHPEALAQRSSQGWTVSADLGWMPGAAGVDAVVLAARLADAPQRIGVFCVDTRSPGVEMPTTRLYDGRHAARLHATQAQAELLHEGPAGDVLQRLQDVLDRGLIVHCAETLGSAQAVFQLSLDYLRTRRQFGQILSDKQVLQHRLVDLYVEQQEARALCLAAAAAPDARTVAALGLRTADVARHSWQEAIQLHGAIGMTEEYAAGEYVRRLAMADRLYGAATDHAERLAQLMLGDQA